MKSGANAIGCSSRHTGSESDKGVVDSLPSFFVKYNPPTFQMFAFVTLLILVHYLFSNVVPVLCPLITLWLCDFDKSLNHNLQKSYGKVMEEVQRSP